MQITEPLSLSVLAEMEALGDPILTLFSARVPTMSPVSRQQSCCGIDTPHTGSPSYKSSTSPYKSRSPPSRDHWKRSFSFATAKSIGRGTSGTIFAVDDTRVIKVFAEDEEGQLDLVREKEIFDKLQIPVSSQYIINCEEQWYSGLVLERLVTTLRELLKDFAKNSPDTQHPLALQWSLESCRGLAFLHQRGVLHGDIGCQNILISDKGHAKLCDFAGSSIGDKHAWVAYEIRSQHPLYSGQQPRIETEIFAIGSLLFEIWTLRRPYASETDPVVKKKFLAGDFPIDSVKGLDIEKIISKCWQGGYHAVSAICKDIEEIERSTQTQGSAGS